MGLPSTGNISLDEIHVEAGGASGTQAAISDSDIMAIVNKTPGQQVAFSEFRGKSASIPDASTSGRRKANGDLLDLYSYAVSTGGPASTEACVEFQMRKITNGFEVLVRRIATASTGTNNPSAVFYTNTGSSSSLGTTFRRVFIVNGMDIDSYKMNWVLVSGFSDTVPDSRYTDSNLKAAEDVFYSNSVRYKVFRVYSYANTSSANNRPSILDINFYGRKAGLADKLFGTYRIDLLANAESTGEITAL